MFGVKKIVDVITPEVLTSLLSKGFTQAGVTSVAVLSNDVLVQTAAQIAYAALPLPVAVVVRFTIGEAGFEKIVFQVRDLMLAKDSFDLSVITSESLLKI